MDAVQAWILLAYHLPREPSTPRITLWRKLRRLGAGQVQDGLVALPQTDRNRERFEWLADEVLDAGGAASVWLAQSLSRSHERQLIDRMTEAVVAEYRALLAQTIAVQADSLGMRRRVVGRLRRELRRIGERDFFPPPERQQARAAVEALATGIEVTT